MQTSPMKIDGQFYYDINIVACYFLSRGSTDEESEEMLHTLIARLDKNYTRRNWEDRVKKIMRNAHHRKLIEVDALPVYQSEMKCIQELRGKPTQKIAFTALAIAKYNNILHETGDGWVTVSPGDLFTLANVSASSEQKMKMIRNLMLDGLIKMSNKVDSTNFRVMFLSDGVDEDPVVYNVTDLRNIGYAYEEAFGEIFDRCEFCGRLIRRSKRKRHYCNDCITKYGYKDTGRVRKPAGVYIVRCVDCGRSFLVDGRAFGKKIRCQECQHKRDLELTRERMRKMREETKRYAGGLQQ